MKKFSQLFTEPEATESTGVFPLRSAGFGSGPRNPFDFLQVKQILNKVSLRTSLFIRREIINSNSHINLFDFYYGLCLFTLLGSGW